MNVGNALQLTDAVVELLCGPDAVVKGARLVKAGAVGDRSVDPDKVHAVVNDDGDNVAVWFSTDLSNFGGFVRNNKQLRRCVAAVMLTWLTSSHTFFPPVGSADMDKLLGNAGFSRLIREALGETGKSTLVSVLRDVQQRAVRPAPASGGSGHAAPASAGPIVSTGAAYWATAAPAAAEGVPLASRLDAEFTTPQLRELARWLDVKLKGTTKSGYIDAVAEALGARAVSMRDTPEALLEGLTAEQADFARRVLTARDHAAPIPRAVIQTVFGRTIGGGPAADRRLTEVCESLRRNALLFPTLMPHYSSYRDIFYQWLPLSASNGNVPVVQWAALGDVSADEASPSDAGSGGGTAVFLNDFDAFLDACIAGGVELRPGMPAHERAERTPWLRGWEHDAAEADRVLGQRAGWAPDPTAGIGVIVHSPVAPDAASMLAGQTGASPAHVDWMFALAAALQLIEAPDVEHGHTGAVAVLPPQPTRVRARASAVEEWLALPVADRLRRAWNAWQRDVFFAGEWRPATAPGWRLMRRIGVRGLSQAELAAEFCAFRRYATRVLRGLAPGKWVSWPKLRRALFDFYPDCAWQILSPDAWWFAPAGAVARNNPNAWPDWEATIGEVFERLVAESLRAFGAVETRAGRDGRLAALRVTDVGDWLLRAAGSLPSAAEPRHREPEPVAWIDDASFRLPPAPNRAEFIAFARRVAEPGDEPFVYRVTNQALERALRQGVTQDEIADVFGRAGAPLPPAAAERVKRLGERFGRVRVYEGVTVLQLNDSYALRELLAGTSLGRHLVHQLSPRAVLVRDDAVDQLVREMEAKGYTPKVLG